MIKLIHTEWLKMKKYPAFWWIMGITALSYPGINYIFYTVYDRTMNNPNQASQLAKLYFGNPFSFPYNWHTVAYFSSWFVFIPAVVVIMLVTNEYSFKTHRQNIIDGWSRNQFVSSKLMDVFIISMLITLLYFSVSLVTGLANHEGAVLNMWEDAHYIALFALQTFAQLSFAFLIGFLIRKAFLALGVFLFYFMVLEPISAGLLKQFSSDEGRFLFLEVSDRMIPIPAFLGKLDEEAYNTALSKINEHIALTIVYTALLWILCYRINQKRDLT